MNVGTIEVAVLILTAAVTAFVAWRTSRAWLMGVVLLSAVAMFGSPADVVSMLLIAVPCSLIYCVAMVRMETRTRLHVDAGV